MKPVPVFHLAETELRAGHQPDRGQRRHRQDVHHRRPVPAADPGEEPVGARDPGGDLHGGGDRGIAPPHPPDAGQGPAGLRTRAPATTLSWARC